MPLYRTLKIVKMIHFMVGVFYRNSKSNKKKPKQMQWVSKQRTVIWKRLYFFLDGNVHCTGLKSSSMDFSDA